MFTVLQSTIHIFVPKKKLVINTFYQIYFSNAKH